MAIEPNTFQALRQLDGESFKDLVETVGLAGLLNVPMVINPQIKIVTASMMMGFAFTMLEHCGCKISCEIRNDIWDESQKYRTGGHLEY